MYDYGHLNLENIIWKNLVSISEMCIMTTEKKICFHEYFHKLTNPIDDINCTGMEDIFNSQSNIKIRE